MPGEEGWVAGGRGKGGGRSSQCQAEKGSLLGNSGSQQEGMCPKSQTRERNVCLIHAHTFTLLSVLEKGLVQTLLSQTHL